MALCFYCCCCCCYYCNIVAEIQSPVADKQTQFNSRARSSFIFFLPLACPLPQTSNVSLLLQQWLHSFSHSVSRLAKLAASLPAARSLGAFCFVVVAVDVVVAAVVVVVAAAATAAADDDDTFLKLQLNRARQKTTSPFQLDE